MTPVRETVALVLGLDPSDVSAETSPETVDGWDSARHIELIFALEDRLGVRFTGDEISEMNSVGKIERVVAAR